MKPKLLTLFLPLLLISLTSFTNDYSRIRERVYTSLHQRVYYSIPFSVIFGERAVSVDVVTMDFVPITVTFKCGTHTLVVVNGAFSSQQQNDDKSYTVFYSINTVPKTLFAFVYLDEKLQNVALTTPGKTVVFYLLDTETKL